MAQISGVCNRSILQGSRVLLYFPLFAHKSQLVLLSVLSVMRVMKLIQQVQVGPLNELVG